MFNKAIERTSLTSNVANSFFFKIHGNHFNGDCSFLATLRALLYSRSGDDDVRFIVGGSRYAPVNIENSSSRAVFEATISPSRYGVNTLILHELRAEDNSAVLKKFDDDFCKEYNNFRELMDLRRFVSKYMNARFYISEAEHKTVILVEDLNLRKYHFLQTLIPRYFPWYFVEKPITDGEKELITTLTNRYAIEYERLIAEFASRIDFRAHAIRSVLGSYEQSARSEQLRMVEQELNENMTRIERTMSTYQALVSQRDDLNVRHAGLRTIINGATENSELVDYFICNRNLTPVSTGDMNFSFIVKCYLDSFDPDMFETMARNPQSHLYQGYLAPPQFRNIEDKKLFLGAIFSEDPKLKVKICAFYRLDARGISTSCTGYMYPDDCRDRMPNPHLQYHNCLGNHQRYINDHILRGDMVRAVEQCVASAKSLNIGEGITACRFFGELMSSRNKVIELPDGTEVNAVEALAWLKAQNTTTEEDSNV